METIYYLIGLIVFWATVSISFIFLIYWLIIKILNELGKRFKVFWIMLEYGYYKKQFKEWVKDKERHPKMKNL